MKISKGYVQNTSSIGRDIYLQFCLPTAKQTSTVVEFLHLVFVWDFDRVVGQGHLKSRLKQKRLYDRCK